MSAVDNIKAMILQSMLTASTDSNSIAEDVVYTPATGQPRTIRALVQRRQPEAYGNSLSPVIVVTVANDADLGIISASVNAGADKLTVSERPGETAEARNIARITANNAAYLTFELR